MKFVHFKSNEFLNQVGIFFLKFVMIYAFFLTHKIILSPAITIRPHIL